MNSQLDDLDDDVSDEPADIVFRAEWSEHYKLAREYLYGSDTVEQDFNGAFRLFLLEVESGNALAMHDLGQMFADGLGREIDADYELAKMFRDGIEIQKNTDKAGEHFKRAFTGFFK